MSKTILREIDAEELTLEKLDFFPCVKSGLYMIEQGRLKEWKGGYGIGLVAYLKRTAQGKIKCSYAGELGVLEYKSKKGNQIKIIIHGGSLGFGGDFLEIIDETNEKTRYALIDREGKIKDIDKDSFQGEMRICYSVKKFPH